MEQISDVAVFVRVVEEGSFTAAAASLHLSKGAVSKFVSRLESGLGARLLNRTTRSLSLTEAGSDFYARASRALAELGEAAEEAREYAGSPRGRLRVAAPPFYASDILARHLCDFNRRFPDITIELLLDNQLIDLIEKRVDVAVRMSAPEDSSLVMRKIADIPVITCASPEYIDRHGRPQTPRDLSRHACLIYTVSPRPRQWSFIDDNGEPYSVSVHGPFELNDDHTLCRLALDGVGIISMPRLFVADAIQAGRLVQLWPDEFSGHVTFAALYPSRSGLPAKARAFIDFVFELHS